MTLSRWNVAFVLLAVVAIAGVAATIVIWRFGRELDEAWSPKTDISRYSEFLQRVRDTGFASHFPDELPSSVVGFYFNPGALQAPLAIQLLVQADADAIHEAVSDAEARISEVRANGMIVDTSERPMNHLAELPNTGDAYTQAIPERFEVLMHHSETRDRWNHGAQEGIAVDKTNNQILYFSDIW